jgi:hypothetical protein
MLDNSLWKILSFILVLYLLFVFPLLHSLERQEEIAYQLAYNETNSFVDSVRDRGYLTPAMLEGFKRRLSQTGNAYEVVLEHLHKQYVPNYSDPGDPTSFLGTYAIVEEAFYQEEIQSVLYPSDVSIPLESRLYRMNQGDLFSVSLRSTSPSLASALKRLLLLQTKDMTPLLVHLGGMIQNEID